MKTISFERGKTYSTHQFVEWAGESYINLLDGQQDLLINAVGSGPAPVITSLQKVTGWAKVKTNVYRVNIPPVKKLASVYIDGKLIPVARFPKTGWINMDSIGEGWTINSAAMPYGNFVGAEAVIRKNRWTIEVSPVKTDVGNTISIEPGEGMERNFGFFFQNHMNCLKKHLDWYATDNTLTVYFSDDPNTHNVEISTLDYLFRIQSSQRVIIEGLDFKGANVSAIKVQKSTETRIYDCDFSGTVNAVVSGANGEENTVIEFNRLKDLYQGGINLDWFCKDSIIKDNEAINISTIPGAWRRGRNGDVFEANSDGILIEGNYSENSGYNGITFFGEGAEVKRNIVKNYCLIADDGGGIYTYNNHNRIFTNWVVEGNLCIGGKGAGEGTNSKDWLPAYGIYLDDNSNHGTVRNNTVIDNNGAGIFIHNSYENSFNGNNLWGNKVGRYSYNDANKLYGNVWASDNVIVSRQNQTPAKEESIIGSTADFFN